MLGALSFVSQTKGS